MARRENDSRVVEDIYLLLAEFLGRNPFYLDEGTEHKLQHRLVSIYYRSRGTFHWLA